MADIRFLKFATKDIYTQRKDQIKETDISFITSTREIIVNNVSYGLPDDISTAINNLNDAVTALQNVKHFGGITVGGQTWEPATDGGALKIEGTNGTTVTVNKTTGTLTIDSSTYSTAIADAKKAGTDAASALATYQASNDAAVAAKVASVTATAAQGIQIGGTATAPTVGIKINTTAPGNVALSTDANGLKASVTIPEDAVKGVVTTDKVLKLDGTSKLLSTTLKLNFDTTSKKLQLLGIGDAVISEFDAASFVRDGMISSENTSFDPDTKVLTIGFNTDAGVSSFNIDLTSLVDTYDGANLKLTATSGFAADTILDTAIKSLKDEIESTTNKVTSFGTKTGAITLDAPTTTTAGTNKVKFVMSNNQLTATVIGLGTAAYKDSTYLDASIADAKQAGTDAKDALDKYKSDVAKDLATVSAKAESALQSIGKGTDGDYVTTTVSAKGSGTTQNVSVALSFQDVSTATSTAKGVAEASNVKSYVDSCLQWVTL